MIRYLIKNNLKIMGRSMTNILLFVIAPLTVIAGKSRIGARFLLEQWTEDLECKQ